MIISQIVAVGKNNEIGKDNDLLWKMPNDTKFFMNTTTGHAVLMGRNTFESLGKRPLKNRTNIIITRQTGYEVPDGCVVVSTIEAGIEYARQHGEEELFIIGGGSVYEQSLHLTNRVYLTRIEGEFDATVFFPKLNSTEWKVVHEDHRQKDERHAYDYTFYTYERV
jgi:dihydrofolate reductase